MLLASDAAWGAVLAVCYACRASTLQCTFDARVRHPNVLSPWRRALLLGVFAFSAGGATAVALLSARVLEDAGVRFSSTATAALHVVALAAVVVRWTNYDDDGAYSLYMYLGVMGVALALAMSRKTRTAFANLHMLAAVATATLVASPALLASLGSHRLYYVRGALVAPLKSGAGHNTRGRIVDSWHNPELAVLFAFATVAQLTLIPWALGNGARTAHDMEHGAAALLWMMNGAAAFWRAMDGAALLLAGLAAARLLAMRVSHARLAGAPQIQVPVTAATRGARLWSAWERAALEWTRCEAAARRAVRQSGLPFGAPPTDADTEIAAVLRQQLERLPTCGAAYVHIGQLVNECLHPPDVLRLCAVDVSEHAASWHLVWPAGCDAAAPTPPYYDLYDGAGRPVRLQVPVVYNEMRAVHGTADADRLKALGEWHYELNGRYEWKLPTASHTGNHGDSDDNDDDDDSAADGLGPAAALRQLTANVAWLQHALSGTFQTEEKRVPFTDRSPNMLSPRLACEFCQDAGAMYNNDGPQFDSTGRLEDNVAVLLTFTVRYVLARSKNEAPAFWLVPQLPDHCPGGCAHGGVPCCNRAHARAVVPASTGPHADLTVLVF